RYPPSCHRNHGLREEKSRVGIALDRQGFLPGKAYRLCRRGRHLLLGFLLLYFLAEETRPYARPEFLKRADLTRRRTPLRFRLPSLYPPCGQQTARGNRHRHHTRRRGDRERIRHRRATGQTHRDERRTDEAVHRVRRRPSSQ